MNVICRFVKKCNEQYIFFWDTQYTINSQTGCVHQWSLFYISFFLWMGCREAGPDAHIAGNAVGLLKGKSRC